MLKYRLGLFSLNIYDHALSWNIDLIEIWTKKDDKFEWSYSNEWCWVGRLLWRYRMCKKEQDMRMTWKTVRFTKFAMSASFVNTASWRSDVQEHNSMKNWRAGNDWKKYFLQGVTHLERSIHEYSWMKIKLPQNFGQLFSFQGYFDDLK